MINVINLYKHTFFVYSDTRISLNYPSDFSYFNKKLSSIVQYMYRKDQPNMHSSLWPFWTKMGMEKQNQKQSRNWENIKFEKIHKYA